MSDIPGTWVDAGVSAWFRCKPAEASGRELVTAILAEVAPLIRAQLIREAVAECQAVREDGGEVRECIGRIRSLNTTETP